MNSIRPFAAWRLWFLSTALLLVGCTSTPDSPDTPVPTQSGLSPDTTSSATSSPSPAQPSAATSAVDQTANGSWFGEGSDGSLLSFGQLDGSVIDFFVTFELDRCSEPGVLLSWDPGELPIANDRFSWTERSFGFADEAISAEGTFDQNLGSWSGTASVTCGDGDPLVLNWIADEFEPLDAETTDEVRTDEALPPVDQGELLGHLPTLTIPDDLFIRGARDQNFDESTWVVGEAGDWLLASYFSSVYPVPSGWTTINTHNEENRLLFSRGGLTVTGDTIVGFEVDPPAEVSIIIGAAWDTSFSTSAEAMEDAKQIADGPDLRLLNATLLSDEQAYLVFEQDAGDDSPTYLLLFLTRHRNPEGHTGFSSLVAVWQATDTAAYYPIIRAVIGGWADFDNNLLGAQLPDELPVP